MQYQVPQFIEVEDKIFGPLTFKQFVYLAGGGGLCLALFTLLPIYIAFLLAIPVVGFAAALAFYQVNGRPFVDAVEHAVAYFFGSKLYLWKQHENRASTASPDAAPIVTQILSVPALSQSKLKDLTWSLNIKDRDTGGASAPQRNGFEI